MKLLQRLVFWTQGVGVQVQGWLTRAEKSNKVENEMTNEVETGIMWGFIMIRFTEGQGKILETAKEWKRECKQSYCLLIFPGSFMIAPVIPIEPTYYVSPTLEGRSVERTLGIILADYSGFLERSSATVIAVDCS